MNRAYFTFFKSYFEAIDELDDEKDQLELYRAICSYSLTGESKTLTSSVSKALFKAIKPNLDFSIKQYENGSKGGRPKNPNKTQTKPNQNPKITQLKPYKEKEKEKEKEKKKEIKNKEPFFDNVTLCNAFEEYISFRKQIKAPMTDRAIELAKDKLLKLGSTDAERIAILNQSIMQGWKGLFPLKEEKGKEQPRYDTSGRHVESI